MNVYVLNIIFTFLWGLVFLAIVGGKHGKKAFCTLTAIQWILISGLRGMSVSRDMYSYQIRFYKTMNTSWNSLFDNFYLTYVDEEGKDPGYSVFEKVIQLFTKDFQIYLFIVAVIFFVALAVWVYKNSEYPMLSMLIFDSFLSSFFAVTGTRQTLATVFVVFIGGYYIKKRKIWPFLLVAAVAFTIHKSAICFVPFYFISQVKVSEKHLAAAFCAFPVLFIFRNRYFRLLGYFVGYEYDELESSGAYGFLFMYLAVMLVAFFLMKYVKMNNSKDYRMKYNALIMGLLLLPLVFENPAAMRTVQYYSLFLMLVIPDFVDCFKKRVRTPIYFGMIVMLLMVTNVYNYSYSFFWQ